ncbi:tyrosine-type recombinase/integrase [Emticicia sp. W12TSBA100-4]|uniref:site-specific integrase n=1 Tax=Emticicia sp. W12TSBA100-4 TaxID=3160965 RepID=UPI0033063447
MAKITNSPIGNKLQDAQHGKGLKSTETRFNVLVWQRKINPKNADTNCTIMIDLQFGKYRKPFSTNMKCKYGDLDTQNWSIKGDTHRTLMLQDMKLRAEKAYIELTLTERSIDLDLIKSIVLGLGVATIPNLQHALTLFLKTVEDDYKVGDKSIGTVRKIKVQTKHISEFGISRLGKNASLEAIVPYDIKEFSNWLKKEKKLSHNVVQMVSGHFKRIMDFAVEKEWIRRNPFMSFRRKFEIKRGEALTEEEVLAIEKLHLITSLDRVRDVFIFMCHTGLSYSDCRALKPHNFLPLETGETYIHKPREKTGTSQTIYLTNRALEILAKYQDDNYCKQYGLILPVISNHKLNLQLKAIGALAKIKKVLTCHVARRSYSTILYNAGLSELATKATMGHTSLEVTLKHYAKAEHKTVLTDLKEAFKRTKLG